VPDTDEAFRGDERGISASSIVILREGENDSASLLIRYAGVVAMSGEDTSAFMEVLNTAIRDNIIAQLAQGDPHGLMVSPGQQVSASMGEELVNDAIFAVLLALLLMMVYIAIRFDFVSGLATIAGLMHDVAIMMAFMIIFWIPINAAFIAALIAMIGYSINNTIIIFDRIRENVRRKSEGADMGTFIANRSVRETLIRTFNTSITTLAMLMLVVLMAAIGGVNDITVFLMPLIIGLIAGSYSSIFISPTLWALVVNKHPDYMQRGAMTGNIRKWFATRSQERKLKKAKKAKTKATTTPVA
jgi:preprotein translocase SecF subunit